MARTEARRNGSREVRIRDVLEQLEELEETVSSSQERREVERTRKMLELVPGRKRIKKYTTRDIAEGFVGAIIFSLPLLVEDGVFEIAEWFVEFLVGPIPVFFVANVLFIFAVTAGLLYYADFRDVQIYPLFGFLPRRLVGVLIVSFIVAFGMLLMWGRLAAEDPSNIEALARVTVIWAAAAFGASLGDILPGESTGTDINAIIDDIGARN